MLTRRSQFLTSCFRNLSSLVKCFIKLHKITLMLVNFIKIVTIFRIQSSSVKLSSARKLGDTLRYHGKLYQIIIWKMSQESLLCFHSAIKINLFFKIKIVQCNIGTIKALILEMVLIYIFLTGLTKTAIQAVILIQVT